MMITTSSTLCQGVTLETCIYNASGCLSSTFDQLEKLNRSASGAILTKSSTVNERKGNEEPRLYFDNFGAINSMGIPNKGYLYYNAIRTSNSLLFRKPVIQSIYPCEKYDLRVMLTKINMSAKTVGFPAAGLVEINMSCPNITNKSIVAYDYNLFREYLEYINELNLNNLIIGIKLPPYFCNDQFENISKILLDYVNIIKYIVCINTISNGLMINYEKEQPVIKNIYGGISGKYCKPVALANIHKFYKLLDNKISIVGCGGVSSGKDVFDMILCGAKAVQVGSHLIKEDTDCFNVIESELIAIMKAKNYKTIEQFRGKLCKSNL